MDHESVFTSSFCKLLVDSQQEGPLDWLWIWSSPNNDHWSVGHDDTSLAFLVNFCQQPPEIRTLRIGTVIFHRRKARFFGGTQMALHKWGVELCL